MKRKTPQAPKPLDRQTLREVKGGKPKTSPSRPLTGFYTTPVASRGTKRLTGFY